MWWCKFVIITAEGLMGQVLHGSAKTTHAVRGELQRSQASVASLAKRFGINEKTVIKWRKRQSGRSEEHTSELQSLMSNSYAVFCLKKKKPKMTQNNTTSKHRN